MLLALVKGLQPFRVQMSVSRRGKGPQRIYMPILNLMGEVLASPTTNVVLSLLILFQWWKQYAKEQSVKNNLSALRRIIISTAKAKNESLSDPALLIEIVDATLATLGSRRPFSVWTERVISFIHKRNERDADEELREPTYLALRTLRK